MTVFQDYPELLRPFRSGDPKSLTRVFQHYVDAVEVIIRHGCRAGETASVPGVRDIDLGRELVHEVFLKAFSPSARNAFDGLRAYRPYLLTIARNTLIGHWRKTGRELERFSPEDLAEVPEPSETPDELDLDFERQLSATRSFLADLNAEQRAFVRFRFEEGLSQRDVAKELKITRWRCRSLESSIRSRLRKYLKQKGLLED